VIPFRCRFVLFTSSGEASLQHLKESWDEAARSQLTEAMPVYHAVVDVDEQPYLADRFNVQGLPAFLLFRNRKVGVSAAGHSMGLPCMPNVNGHNPCTSRGHRLRLWPYSELHLWRTCTVFAL